MNSAESFGSLSCTLLVELHVILVFFFYKIKISQSCRTCMTELVSDVVVEVGDFSFHLHKVHLLH